VWQFVESTSFIIRTESSSRKEATADDSDNGASGYTDWDCIFHLHFKMQMSRRVVLRTPCPFPVPLLLPFPPRLLQNASMAQMRTNLYARTLWIRIRFRMGKCISWAGESVSTHKCAQINVSYLSFYLGFDKRPGFPRASERKYSMYNVHTWELITC